MLALPAITQGAGFGASIVALVGCCGYSIVTGLLLAEVCLNTMRQQGAGNVSLVSMTQRSLGRSWQGLVSSLYVLQHMTLLVAYMSRAGGILSAMLSVPLAAASTAFALGTAWLCYALPSKQLDLVNGVMVAGFIATFLVLVVLVLPTVQPSSLLVARWSEVPGTLAVIALSFVYQNIVPVLVKDLEGNVGKIRRAIVYGSLLPLAMFTAWEAACLGAWDSLSAAASQAAQVAGQAAAEAASSVALLDPVQALAQLGGDVVGPLVSAFSLLTIATSYIGFCLGLTDFLADLLHLGRSSSSSLSAGGCPAQQQPGGQAQAQAAATIGGGEEAVPGWRQWTSALGAGEGRALTYVLTVLPPLALALTFPDIFFSALDVAGAFGVMSLFGVLPAALAWAQREGGPSRGAGMEADRHLVEIVPGGKSMLGAVGGFGAVVILYELVCRVQGQGH